MTNADDLRLRAAYLDDAVIALRERGDAIRAASTAPWQVTRFTTEDSPVAIGHAYFNAAVAARRLAAELRELADMEEKING